MAKKTYEDLKEKLLSVPGAKEHMEKSLDKPYVVNGEEVKVLRENYGLSHEAFCLWLSGQKIDLPLDTLLKLESNAMYVGYQTYEHMVSSLLETYGENEAVQSRFLANPKRQ